MAIPLDAAIERLFVILPPRLAARWNEEATAALEALRQVAATAWPGFVLDREVYFAHVAARLDDELGPAEALAVVQAADLYLACGCLEGRPAALAGFARTLGSHVERALARLDLGGADRADVAQGLSEAFFVRRTLSKFSGRGSLRAWVRSAATRAGLDLIAARRPHFDRAEDILDNLVSTGDVELDLARRQFQDEFNAAFAAAVAALAAEDKLLLTQHYVDDLSIDRLAVHYGLHRASVARRIVRVRTALLKGTQEALGARLRIDRAELDSLMRLVKSRMQTSVYRLLAS